MSEYIVEMYDECEKYVLEYGCKPTYTQGFPLREEIVRCRDCRHMRTIDLSVYYGEHKHDLDICIRVDGVQLNAEPDGYCSWAEKRTNE